MLILTKSYRILQIEIISNNITQHNISNLQPYTDYSITAYSVVNTYDVNRDESERSRKTFSTNVRSKLTTTGDDKLDLKFLRIDLYFSKLKVIIFHKNFKQ